MAFYVLDAIAIVAAAVCLRSWLSWRKRRAVALPYPPGPKGLPIIGNVFDMPGKDEWETARQWGEKYGDMIFVEVFGTKYLFVNSYEKAVDLFEKRGSMYSDRPQNTMIELEGWSDWFITMMPYGDDLRKGRQYLNKFFHRPSTREYYELQTKATHKLLGNLLQSPDSFRDHIRYLAAETIIKIAYGYQIVDDDPYIELVDKGMESFSEALTFFLVNALPPLRHLPTWFPGANFHKIAAEGYKVSMAMYHEPYKKAKESIANGTAAPSMTSKLLEWNTDRNGNILNEELIAKVVGIAYAGGGDTSVSALCTFILAMVKYPESLKKAQEEIDTVVGRDTLPTFEDRSKLPYVEAICSECLRWQTVAPIGVPHTTVVDDVYNGYFIPAGTSIYGNTWAILRDPKRYPEPDKFIPERWLQKERPLDVNKVAFGFGRRICPGRFFAENSIFIGIACILAVFDIQKALDENGVPITPAEDYTSVIVSHPKPFKCKITPRSDAAIALVRQAETLAK